MRTAFCILFFISSAAGIAQQAELTFTDPLHRFGKVNEGAQLSYPYRFTNTGDAPLIFYRYNVACPCTVANLPEKSILPGDSGTITIHFDTNGKIAYQDRIVKIYSNAGGSPHEVRFTVKIKNPKPHR